VYGGVLTSFGVSVNCHQVGQAQIEEKVRSRDSRVYNEGHLKVNLYTSSIVNKVRVKRPEKLFSPPSRNIYRPATVSGRAQMGKGGGGNQVATGPLKGGGATDARD